MKTLPDAIVGVDGRGLVRSLNESAERLFGYREIDFLGQPFSVLIHGATASRTRQGTPWDPPSYASPADCSIRAKAIGNDGRRFPVSCFPLRLAAPRNQSYVLIRDESQRLPESGLRQRCECLASALRAFPAPLLVVDRNGSVLMFNQACEEVFGDALRPGANLQVLFPGIPLRTMLVGQMGKGHALRLPHSRSGCLFTFPGSEAWPAPDYVVLMGQAPDEVRRARTQAAAMHRLENLMTEISGFSELLLADVGSDNPMHEDLSRVHGASRRAMAVLQALLAGVS
ncbi:MAG: PAS domain-containing protein [Bryobacteraceae bacterium]